ncbi:MAG: hypothetical protein QXS48_04375 [Candidatus Aenigmatarchaeota archaeon]
MMELTKLRVYKFLVIFYEKLHSIEKIFFGSEYFYKKAEKICCKAEKIIKNYKSLKRFE